MSSRTIRRRQAKSDSPAPPEKRSRPTSNGNGSNKRAKTEGPRLSPKEERIVEIRAMFNLAVNELFQLREYKSLVDWKPSDFSVPFIGTHIPELYASFLADPRHQLQWDPEIENAQDMMHLPLRLQKKVLAEIEAKLQEKYPFKDKLLRESEEIERELILEAENINKAIPVKSEPIKKPKSKPRKQPDVSPEEWESLLSMKEFEYDSDMSIPDTNYKIKSVKYTLPPQKVTNPLHIPSWSPTNAGTGETIHGSDERLFDYKPKSFVATQTQGSVSYSPDIQQKLRSFLSHSYKAAIIDESIMPDYSNKPEEYEKVMSQQKAMFKALHKKIMVENTMQLNGDKIELRKVHLPQTNMKSGSDPYRNTGTVLPKIQGARNNLTFHDHFLAQAESFARIHQQARKQHQLRTRKVASMIEQHFKKKAGEKERLLREQEQNLRRISRMAIQAVKKRWSQAQKVYSFVQQQKEDEIKKIQGREHLNKMLEHSTQLLEAQLSKGARNESSSSESDSDDNLSSDESDDDDVKKETNDMDLSIEALKAKYADLDKKEVSEVSDEEMASSDDGIDVSKGLSALYGGTAQSVTPPQDYTEDQIKLIEEEDLPQTLMDSDSSISTSGSESESEETSESEAEPSKNGGLSSLFSKNVEEEEEYEEEGDEEGEEKEGEEGEGEVEVKSEDEAGIKSEEQIVKSDEEEMVNGAKVKDVPTPHLLRGTLRPYQKQGLNWLASLYNNNTNGILADEMGLGKTIQTISLLSYLACEHHVWGPHLIVVPTSVMLNWEMEFKKFAPGFKVLTYYGSPQQRAQKRKGWNKPDAFHVCITSYQLVVHDHQSFKRRRWKYMILDEAHNIKNFRSARWKALLNFNTENRLLLTGTPLQNNVMELWSLLYFLMPSSKIKRAMPSGFADLDNFQQWFGRPVDKILEQTSADADKDIVGDDDSTTSRLDKETKNTVARLHQVLRPYLLRRLKKDVEKQMPGKYEHIVYCRLSKRQRFLYDDFMSRAKTKETLASGNFLSIINCLMQLRKVCNHPDLFEIRPVVTSFAMPKSVVNVFQSSNDIVRRELSRRSPFETLDLNLLNLDVTNTDGMNYFVSQSTEALKITTVFDDQIRKLDALLEASAQYSKPNLENTLEYYRYLKTKDQMEYKGKLEHHLYLNNLRCGRKPIYGESLLKFLKRSKPVPTTDVFRSFEFSIPQRVHDLKDMIENFCVLTPPVVAMDMKDQLIPVSTQYNIMEKVSQNEIHNPFIKTQVKLSIGFPDKSLLQYDCGKLQKLASLLQDLTANGHRALIFTQMTKVLDILEQFLNIHGYRYMRLDGATKIDDRQLMTERFNRDPKIPVFILSTRSGGLGINLTGADTVIFYDSDWNPAMDKQCQDRCHRIGQSRDVHIYRFVSEYTIESNILKKANQKRQLYNVVIQEGEFTTDYFGKFSVRDLVDDVGNEQLPDQILDFEGGQNLLAQAEDEEDRSAANEAMKEVAIDDEDFDEDKKSASASATPAPTTPGSPHAAPTEKNMDVDFDDGIGHIDEYMLRFISDGYYMD